MSILKKYAIIVSGGTGSRMESQFPKQFLELRGLPILMHTINAFHGCSGDIKIVLVLNESHRGLWDNLCSKHRFNLAYDIVSGGESRFHSVRNGIDHILDKEPDLDNVLVSVHDGVRPFANQQLVDASYEGAEKYGSAIPVIKSKDSIRVLDSAGNNSSVDRDLVLMIQTPQTFQASLLSKAYQHPYKEGFTDDASVIENSGYAVHLIEGDIRNIKITYPIDLKIAEVLMSES